MIMSDKPSIFISYSHEDEEEMKFVYRHLRPLERYGKLECWHDKKMSGGDAWRQGIKRQLDQCSIAIILISIDFLNSEFIQNHEVQQMLERHARDQLRIYPIRIRSCHYKTHPWLDELNHRPECGTWLMETEEKKREPLMTAIVAEIDELLAKRACMHEPIHGATRTEATHSVKRAEAVPGIRNWGTPFDFEEPKTTPGTEWRYRVARPSPASPGADQYPWSACLVGRSGNSGAG